MGTAEFDALTPDELAEYRGAWLASQRRLDQRAGVLAALIANVNRDSKRRRKPFVPADFYPSLGKTTRRLPTPHQFYQNLAALTGGLPPDAVIPPDSEAAD
ncbi:MAG: hypothetical protein IT435_05635 [Phycisphaerales bacterium]|nr:hypothetical protein [Phycisphaerales bacterium]